MSEATLQRKLDRATAKVAVLEGMIEEKTRDLFRASEEMRRSNVFLESVYRTMPSALVVFDLNGVVQRVNAAAVCLLERDEDALIGHRIGELFHEKDPLTQEQMAELAQAGVQSNRERILKGPSNAEIPVLFYASTTEAADPSNRHVVCVAVDLRERKRLEVDLRHAQKLESVGQLAAGVAHEINTPIQFVGDSVHFLKEAFDDLSQLVATFEGLREAAKGKVPDELLDAVDEARDDADLDFLSTEAPKAIERTLQGVRRVAEIVKAMKEFSHPDVRQKCAADINRAITQTLTVARNEYKYVAEVESSFGELPPVVCHLGDLNQVFLNLIVNAAHAVGAVHEQTGELGKIFIETHHDEDDVVVTIRDTGTGIPEDIVGKIFDPFFTTKEVGKGTGQGLAIARNVVVEKHAGKLCVESELGSGTTFTVRLPVDGEAKAAA